MSEVSNIKRKTHNPNVLRFEVKGDFRFFIYGLTHGSKLIIFYSKLQDTYEVWSGRLTNYENLRVFDTLTFVHVMTDKLKARKF